MRDTARVIALCTITSFPYRAALSMINTAASSSFPEYQADLIAMDLTNALVVHPNHRNDASSDCWIKAVESLLLSISATTMEEELKEEGSSRRTGAAPSHPSSGINSSCCLSSAGTNFCSNLVNTQKKEFALRLAKCHLEESNRFDSMPESCQIFDGGSSADKNINMSKVVQKEVTLRQCLFDLSSESFLVYTQFFLLVESACTKLTSELLIHRKLDAVTRFHETALFMERQVRQALQLQKGLMYEMSKQEESFQRLRSTIQSIERDIMLANQQITSYNRFISSLEDVSTLLQANVSCIVIIRCYYF